VVLLIALLAAGDGAALTPNADPRFRDGANHHLGDDGVVAELGRQPGPGEERIRSHAHLLAVRRMLGLRPATRPELEGRRAELLDDLDAYIAAGTTPVNERLPWRTPVFIDDAGRVCAVGYLIERSAGRELAETIARGHRYEYLEEIAAAMPEVRAWVASSGFTLDELASIQPGYEAPIVETWSAWDLAKHPIVDGPFEESSDDGTTSGAIEGGAMTGSWKRVDAHGALVGTGDFSHGAGVWRSVYPDGAAMAEGPFVANRPHGQWSFHHPSGAVAATGRFDGGVRAGRWRFYHDTTRPTPIATGSFAGGRPSGTWHHFDSAGRLLAVSSDANLREWTEGFGGYLLDILPGQDGIRHQVHQGNVAGDSHRLDAIMSRDGRERLYVHARTNEVFDRAGQKLERVAGAWRTCSGGFTPARERAASSGNLAALHGLIFRDQESTPCARPRPVPSARGRRLDQLFASVAAVRSLSPDFVRRLALGVGSVEEAAAEIDDRGDTPVAALADVHDLAKVLAANMAWYVEWPHVDGRFLAVFRTLPGYAVRGR